MQPAGFKETAASFSASGPAGTSFDGLSPASKLGHLGASLGNQAFHTVATQQSHDNTAKFAAAGTQRFQQAFQTTMDRIKKQRVTAEVHDHNDHNKYHNQQKMKIEPDKSNAAAKSASINGAASIPTMEDMMGIHSKKSNTQSVKLKEKDKLIHLTSEQRIFFGQHPELLHQFQQQQMDLLQSKNDESAVKKALFGNLGDAPEPPKPTHFFL